MDNFNIKSILVILFLFFIGCVMGWCIEVIFRKFLSKSNPSHKWINPGVLIGPYLPLYGSGLVVLYLLSLIHIDAVDAHPVEDAIAGVHLHSEFRKHLACCRNLGGHLSSI